MKRFGKFEKQAEVTPKKQPDVKKSVLLQTYFTSLLSLVLCTTMFFGTSYAWFSSEVTSAENEIYVGTLKVGLYKDSDVNLASGDGSNNNKLFDSSLRWVPGFTTLETIRVANEGELAFKYVLSFTDGSVTGEKDLATVAENFEVWVYDHKDRPAPNPASFSDISAEGSGWVCVGLDEVLSGTPVLEGVKASGSENNADVYTVALHMKENANASVMGHVIKLNVKLVAYQLNSESNALAKSYDEIVTVSNEEQLEAAFNNSLLISNIEIKREAGCEITVNGVMDGNGKTISGKPMVVVASNGGEICNLTIKNVLKPQGGITLTNCTFEKGTLDVSAMQTYGTVTLVNCNYSGKLIEKAVLTANGETVTITETNALTVTGEKMIALK